MPHTRAARLRAMQEASDLRDMGHLSDTNTNLGWNDYVDWDSPTLMYQPESLPWFPSGEELTDDQTYFAEAQSSTIVPAAAPLDISYERAPKSEFGGLQNWYSNAPRDLTSVSAVSPAATTRSPLSTSAFTSYNCTSLDEEGQPADQAHSSQQWPPKISRREPSLDEEMYSRRASDAQAAEPVQRLGEPQSPSSEEENERVSGAKSDEVELERVSTAKSDAYKKRKIAHSVIEKNYRCRIKDGMAELRHCVPSKEKGRRSIDAEGQYVSSDVTANQSSGKVAILSDAVQYVRELERQNEALHGQLDTMQRRNNTLQKIALSKADTTVTVEEIDDENGEEQTGGQAGQESQRPRARGYDEGRFKAVAHAPSLLRRHGSVLGTSAGIKISAE